MSDEFAIISYPQSRNMGDEVQSLAAARLLPRVDHFVPREEVHQFTAPGSGRVKLICNGWFTPEPEAWPPSPSVDPLMVSFHATHKRGADRQLISQQHADFYRRVAPIGCRDNGTRQKLEALGIDSYFSGCLTLTLDNPFGPDVERDGILVVDPFYMFNGPRRYEQDCLDILIPERVRPEVEFITQWRPKGAMPPVEQKFKEAEALLERYARAKLVVTSRIHCALPCLAMGTPVCFLDIGYDTGSLRDRFDGIMGLFNVVDGSHFPMRGSRRGLRTLRKLGLHRLARRNRAPVPIDWDQPTPNPDRHLEIRARLKEVVQDFVNA